jgi:hypothetical protein
MKLVVLVFAALALGPTWSEYALYNAHRTALAVGMPDAQVTCTTPLPSGNSRCFAVNKLKLAKMLCPTYEYSLCETWVRPLK